MANTPSTDIYAEIAFKTWGHYPDFEENQKAYRDLAKKTSGFMLYSGGTHTPLAVLSAEQFKALWEEINAERIEMSNPPRMNLDRSGSRFDVAPIVIPRKKAR